MLKITSKKEGVEIEVSGNTEELTLELVVAIKDLYETFSQKSNMVAMVFIKFLQDFLSDTNSPLYNNYPMAKAPEDKVEAHIIDLSDCKSPEDIETILDSALHSILERVKRLGEDSGE